MTNAIVFVVDVNYQKYLDYMAFQMRDVNIDIFVIADRDVKIPDKFQRIDYGSFKTDIGMTGMYKPNHH